MGVSEFAGTIGKAAEKLGEVPRQFDKN